jgi:hypothetical protein
MLRHRAAFGQIFAEALHSPCSTRHTRGEKSASGKFNVQRSSENPREKRHRVSGIRAIVSQRVKSSNVNRYARVGATTDSVRCTQTQLDKQVEHAVDREEYLRRDREIQRALERMATKDELRDVNDTLRPIQDTIAPRRR